MPSYTAQAILSEPTHTSLTEMYKAGDIVNVYELITEKPNINGRMCFIHVHEVPDNINLKSLRLELSRPELALEASDPEITKRRAWMIKLDELMEYKVLESDKQVHIGWSTAAELFVRKSDGITGGEYYLGLNL